MGKASQENIDALLAAVRAHFPDADLLARLTEPGAIDDVNDLMLATTAQTFVDLPSRQESVIRAYRSAAERLASVGRPCLPVEGPRLALAEALRASLVAYHVAPSLIDAICDPAILGYYDDAHIASLSDSIEKLRQFQRNMLQALLDADDRAEERARARATKETTLDVSPEDVEKAAQALQARLASESGREARIATATARTEESLRSTLESAATFHKSATPPKG